MIYGQIVFFLGAFVMLIGGVLMHLAAESTYSYMVTYSFEKGKGRIFITRNSPIKTDDDIVELDSFIAKRNGVEGKKLHVTNFVKLKGIKP